MTLTRPEARLQAPAAAQEVRPQHSRPLLLVCQSLRKTTKLILFNATIIIFVFLFYRGYLVSQHKQVMSRFIFLSFALCFAFFYIVLYCIALYYIVSFCTLMYRFVLYCIAL